MRTIIAIVLLTTAIAARAMAQNTHSAQVQPASEQSYSDPYRGYSTAKMYGPGEW